MTPDPNAEVPLRTMSMSQARHDFNTLPQMFDHNPEPLYIEHKGQIVMAILGLETYTLMTGAIEFIKANGMLPLFDQWLAAEVGGEEEAAAAMAQVSAEQGEEMEDQEAMDTAVARAAIEAQIKNNPEFGEAFLKNLTETREWAEKVIAEQKNNPAPAQ